METTIPSLMKESYDLFLSHSLKGGLLITFLHFQFPNESFKTLNF